MKKVWIALFVSLLIVAIATMASASADPTLNISTMENGDVLVSWDAFGNESTYEVRYTIDGGHIRWGDYESTNVRGTSYTLTDLVPGQRYQIYVGNGNQSITQNYYIHTEDFTGFKNDIRIVLDPKNMKDGHTHMIDALSVRDIESGDGYAYGLRIEYHYPSLNNPRTYKSSLAISSPLGYVAYTHVEPFDMPKGSTYTYYGFFDLTYYFETLRDDYGVIPTGTYSLELYLDGDLAGSNTFEVLP